MPDQDKSTLPTDFEETAGFRESTLHLFPPEHADTLRRFGRLLHDLILDGEPYWPEGESLTYREMTAALADALHLRDFLWHVSREIEQSELSPDDSRLALLARELVDAMDDVVTSLQEGVE
jgi:hypothetical protein